MAWSKYIAAIVLSAICTNANAASYLYMYEGVNYDVINDSPLIEGTYTDQMRLRIEMRTDELLPEGMFVLDEHMNIVGYDGRFECSTSDPDVTLPGSYLEVNSSGEITDWLVALRYRYQYQPSAGLQVGIMSSRYFERDAKNNGELVQRQLCIDDACSTKAFDNATPGAFGSWAITPVPIPAAAWLLGSALGLLGWMRRRSE